MLVVVSAIRVAICIYLFNMLPPICVIKLDLSTLIVVPCEPNIDEKVVLQEIFFLKIAELQPIYLVKKLSRIKSLYHNKVLDPIIHPVIIKTLSC